MKEQVKNSILQTGKLDGVKWFTKGHIVVVTGFSSFVKKEELETCYKDHQSLD